MKGIFVNLETCAHYSHLKNRMSYEQEWKLQRESRSVVSLNTVQVRMKYFLFEGRNYDKKS